MTRPAPATSEAPAPSAPSGQLLRALLSSAGLSVRGDVVSAPASAGKKKRPARMRRAPTANR